MDVLILKRNNGYTAKEISDQSKTQPSRLSTGSCSSVLGIWDFWWNHWAPEGVGSPVSPALLPVTLIAFLLVIFTLSSVDVQRFCHLQHPRSLLQLLLTQLYSLSSWGLLGGTVLWKDPATHLWLQWFSRTHWVLHLSCLQNWCHFDNTQIWLLSWDGALSLGL